MRQGIPYDSDEGRAWASFLAAVLTGVAYETSGILAQNWGAFSGWKQNQSSMLKVIQKHHRAVRALHWAPTSEDLRKLKDLWGRVLHFAQSTGFRNAQVTAMAPTGTIGLLMDSETTGIEPEYALVRRKNFEGLRSQVFVASSFEIGLRHLKKYSSAEIESILKQVREKGSAQSVVMLKESDRRRFETAMEMSPQGHIQMVAALQPFVSGAISKTVNLPASTLPQEIEEIYFSAWKAGLKAISIYRDGSKSSQPLQTGS